MSVVIVHCVHSDFGAASEKRQEFGTKEPNQRIARAIFFIKANEMVLLQGFIKKAQKTTKPDLDLAIKRKKEVEKND